MNNEVTTKQELSEDIINNIVLKGDLSGLTPKEKREYYFARCKQVGVDASAMPFQMLKLNGKEVLYATAGLTQQLCQLHGLSVAIVSREKVEDVYCVHARVTDKEGRVTENMGAVAVGASKGEMLANMFLKATTKAIRRSVLAHCGLGVMDETEVETIPGAATMPVEGKKINETQSGIIIDLLMQCSADARERFAQKHPKAPDVPAADFDRVVAHLGKCANEYQVAQATQEPIQIAGGELYGA